MKFTRWNELMDERDVIRGSWTLNDNHELEYREKQDEKAVKLTAPLIAAEPDALVVAVTAKQADKRIVTSTAKLTGRWRANHKNQLVFEVEKEGGRRDILTFRGAWEVNESHEIIYTWEQRWLKRKTKQIQALAFKGHWELSEKNRLTYYLEGSSDSAFRFRGSFKTKSISAREGEIRYQIGVEVAGKKELKTITLFGKWKLSRDFELSFEIEYADGKRYEMRFGAVFHAGDGFTLEAELINREGHSLGIEVILTKELFKGQAETFLRLRKTVEESALEAGMRIPW